MMYITHVTAKKVNKTPTYDAPNVAAFVRAIDSVVLRLCDASPPSPRVRPAAEVRDLAESAYALMGTLLGAQELARGGK